MNLWMVTAIAAGFVDLLLFVIVCNLWEENAALHKRWESLVAFIKGRSPQTWREFVDNMMGLAMYFVLLLIVFCIYAVIATEKTPG